MKEWPLWSLRMQIGSVWSLSRIVRGSGTSPVSPESKVGLKGWSVLYVHSPTLNKKLILIITEDNITYYFCLCLAVAITALKEREPGAFLIRDSNSFQGAYGLALKVATPPANVNQSSKGKIHCLSYSHVYYFSLATAAQPRDVLLFQPLQFVLGTWWYLQLVNSESLLLQWATRWSSWSDTSS